MTTNILSLPEFVVEITTATNEDWIDGFAFFYDEALTQPIDLTGIQFDMEVRHLPPDATVVLKGSSTDKSMLVLSNTLMLNFDVLAMSKVAPLDYVFDIVMSADTYTRVLANGDLTVTLGITREPGLTL